MKPFQQAQKSQNGRKLLVAGVFILLISLAFTTLLIILTLESRYTASLLGRYVVQLGELERRIEVSLRFGKNLAQFHGLNEMLDTALANMAGLEGRNRIDVLLPNGVIRYSTDAGVEGRLIEPSVRDFIAGDDTRRLRQGDVHLLFRAIEGRNTVRQGTLLFTIDHAPVHNALKKMLFESLIVALFFSFGIVVLFFLMGIGRTLLAIHSVKRPRLPVKAVLFVALCLCQAGYIVERVQVYEKELIHLHGVQVLVLNGMLQRDVEHLLRLGLPLERLYKMDELLARSLERLPEVDEIRITDAFGRILHTSRGALFSQTNLQPWPAGDAGVFVLPLHTGDTLQGQIYTRLSKEHIRRQVSALYWDAGTVALISLFLGAELLALLARFQRPGISSGAPGSSVTAVSRMRMVAFCFFFGTDIAISFLPLQMASIYQPILNLPRELVLGLPITIQMLCTALAFLGAGRWSDRRGWQHPFQAGLLLSGCGYLIAAGAAQPLVYLLGMGVVGYGYGLSYMAGQNFVVAACPENNRGVGLSEYYAGCIAGSICGSATGALLADRVGYAPVFFLGGLTILASLAVARYTLRNFFGLTARELQPASQSGLRHLFANRHILAVVLCSSLPAAMALVGFMNYFSPVYLNSIGASQSTIGRFFMLYGICMIFLAPWMTRRLGSRLPRIPIILAGLMGSAAFGIFRLWEGPVAVGLGILLLGIASSFNAIRNAYAINLPISRQVGAGRTMGMIFFIARLGQMAGPVLFGILLAAGDVMDAILIVGLAYLILTLLFGILSRPAPMGKERT